MSPTPKPYVARDGTVTWKVRFRVEGENSPTMETFDDAAQAERFSRLVEQIGGKAAREARTASSASARRTLSLRTWFDRHLSMLEASATPGTIAEYRRAAERTWLPRLGALPIDAVTRKAVVGWVAHQRTVETRQSAQRRAKAEREGRTPPPVETYSAKSIANAQRLLSSVMAAAVEADELTKNPARGIPLPRDRERHEMRFASPNEYAALIGEVDPHYVPLVAFLFGTGARFGEATALRPSDFDLDAAQPVVRISRAWKKGASGVYLGAPKSARSVRTVTLGPDLVRTLRPVVEGAGRDALVFTTHRGARVPAQRFRERVWHPAASRAGLAGLRVHDARHSHVSWLIANGESPAVIQRRVGHESIKTTMDVYGHLAPDAHAGAALTADRAMSGGHPQIEE